MVFAINYTDDEDQTGVLKQLLLIKQDLLVLKNQIKILLNYVTNSRDKNQNITQNRDCLLYTSPSPRD